MRFQIFLHFSKESIGRAGDLYEVLREAGEAVAEL
jgi:hypothetical protein